MTEPELAPSTPGLARGSRGAWTLIAGLALAVVAMVLTHPLAILGLLALSLAYAHRAGLHERTWLVHKAALGLALAVLGFNALFSWNGATVLWQAPFRIELLGRPRLTLQALQWGAIAGLQLASTVLALGAATLAVPPEVFHRTLVGLGVPRRLATAGALALRMVPDTSRDAQAMGQALRVRGLDATGIAGTSQVLVPLTARALDRAMVAEEALLLRGYGASARRSRPPGLVPAGLLALAALLAAAALALWGPGRPAYYPSLALPLEPASLGLVLAGLLIPLVLVKGVAPSSR